MAHPPDPFLARFGHNPFDPFVSPIAPRQTLCPPIAVDALRGIVVKERNVRARTRRFHNMTRLLRQLWRDDDGAVISVELVLIISILVFGLIPGLVALRNSGISLMATLGNMANALVPSFTFSGFSILAGSGTSIITLVQVGGVSFTPTPQNLTGAQITPIQASGNVIVPPAP